MSGTSARVIISSFITTAFLRCKKAAMRLGAGGQQPYVHSLVWTPRPARENPMCLQIGRTTRMSRSKSVTHFQYLKMHCPLQDREDPQMSEVATHQTMDSLHAPKQIRMPAGQVGPRQLHSTPRPCHRTHWSFVSCWCNHASLLWFIRLKLLTWQAQSCPMPPHITTISRRHCPTSSPQHGSHLNHISLCPQFATVQSPLNQHNEVLSHDYQEQDFVNSILNIIDVSASISHQAPLNPI